MILPIACICLDYFNDCSIAHVYYSFQLAAHLLYRRLYIRMQSRMERKYTPIITT